MASISPLVWFADGLVSPLGHTVMNEGGVVHGGDGSGADAGHLFFDGDVEEPTVNKEDKKRKRDKKHKKDKKHKNDKKHKKDKKRKRDAFIGMENVLVGAPQMGQHAVLFTRYRVFVRCRWCGSAWPSGPCSRVDRH